MTKRNQVWVALGLLWAHGVSAEIRESASLEQIWRTVDANTVVVFDLDNTVLEAAQTLGTDQFFEYWVRQGRAAGLTEEQARDQALANAAQVQPKSEVRSVEPITPGLILEMQVRGIPTLALTARPIAWAGNTLVQVASLGVDFRRSALYRGDGPFGRDGRGRNQGGVLFMPTGGDKGNYLKDFLEASAVPFTKLIFIDDKLRNVQSVDAAFHGGPIQHVEYRYGAADTRVAAFDVRLADFVWGFFMREGVILGDAEARRRMPSPDLGKSASQLRQAFVQCVQLKSPGVNATE